VHIDRSTPVHQIKYVNVTSQLIGDFTADTHATGDNRLFEGRRAGARR
jgi:hypothetical protein